MDDALYGQRDRRGDWKPFRHVEYPAVFVWPAQPLAVLKWLFGYPGYILPWNLLYGAVAVLVWLYLTPSVDTLQTFAPGWIAFILARNVGLVVLVGLGTRGGRTKVSEFAIAHSFGKKGCLEAFCGERL